MLAQAYDWPLEPVIKVPVGADEHEEREVHVIHSLEVMMAYIETKLKPVYGTLYVSNGQTNALTALIIAHDNRQRQFGMRGVTEADLNRKFLNSHEWYWWEPLEKTYRCTRDYLYGFLDGWEGKHQITPKPRRVKKADHQDFLRGRWDGYTAHLLIQPTAYSA